MRSPRDIERQAMEAARVRVQARSPRIAVSIKGAKGLQLGRADHSDEEGHRYHLADVFGTRSLEFVASMLTELGQATKDHSSDLDMGPGSLDQTSLNAALAVIDGVRPADEIEAMLAAHMAVTNIALLELMARTRGAIAGHLYQGSGIKRLDILGNLTTKFMRTYAIQVETLAKKRRKGEQTVTVKHVHVHPGAQAVIGNVSHGGGRGVLKNDHRAHECIQQSPAGAIADSTAMWCTDEEREALPIASDSKGPLPNARRRAG
jgi:hypothetical protein